MVPSAAYQAACRIDPAAPFDRRVEQVLADPDLQAEVAGRAFAQIDALAAQGKMTVDALRFRDRLLAKLCASARADDPAYDGVREVMASRQARQAAPREAAELGTGPRRLDWGKAAELLAHGLKPTDVAATLGCTPERIWQNLERSAKFRRRVEHQRQRHLQAAAFRLNGATEQLANGLITGIDRQNPRVMLWMAERLKLGTGALGTNATLRTPAILPRPAAPPTSESESNT